jgi:hypothetical protein
MAIEFAYVPATSDGCTVREAAELQPIDVVGDPEAEPLDWLYRRLLAYVDATEPDSVLAAR